jgi:hypothetical protein
LLWKQRPGATFIGLFRLILRIHTEIPGKKPLCPREPSQWGAHL